MRKVHLRVGVCDLGAGLRDLDAEVRDPGARLRDLDPQISDLGARLRDLDAQIGDLGARLDDFGARLRDTRVHVRDLGAQISDLGARLRDLDTEVLAAKSAISGAATGVVRKRAPARARESAHTGSLLFNNTSSTPNIPAVIANKTPIATPHVLHSVNPHAPMIASLPICAIAHWK